MKPFGPDHAYVTVPTGVPDGVALKFSVEPAQRVWLAIFSRVTEGAFTVMVPLTELLPQSPSIVMV